MPEIIDILTVNPTDQQRFTVNTAAVDYNVTSVFPFGPHYLLQNANGKNLFREGDNFIILSMGLVFPESFTPWKNPADLGGLGLPIDTLFIKGLSTTVYHIDAFGGEYDNLYIPFENFELNTDVFVSCQKQESSVTPGTYLNESFRLATDNLNPIKISMLNVPAVFNGKTFAISPFFKILHNFDLT